MLFKDIPIRKKLMRVILLINGIVLFVTCFAFFIYEFYVFRNSTVEKLSTIGKIISVNSTATLAFDDPDAAKEILTSLKTEKNIVTACLYDKNGKLFAQYPDTVTINNLPAGSARRGYIFTESSLEGYEAIMQEGKMLGNLYLKFDLAPMYERLRLYIILTVSVIAVSFLLTFLLSNILQRHISYPILELAKTAKQVSGQKDYSVRAVKYGNDELGLLTDAFNQMLEEIHTQNISLSEFNQNLEQNVRDRTRQLESVNKELEAFSYSISHDLRAPLRGVVGFTSLLEEKYSTSLDDEAKRIINVIRSNTLKMGNLIDDLLTFSRMGRNDIIKQNISVAGLVKEVVNELNGRDDNINWDIQLLPDCYGDVNALRQVWVNLISNAIKYSRKADSPSITIGSLYSKEKGEIIFFVKDNGVGFDIKYSNKLFKVFQRLHSSEEFEGTGVGLAIVEKIISKHGGTVWVEAEKNKGATFYFSLPEGELLNTAKSKF